MIVNGKNPKARRSFSVRRSDGEWASFECPANVDLAAVKRAFDALKKGVIPFWLTPAERDFVADVIGEFEGRKAAEAGGEGGGNSAA